MSDSERIVLDIPVDLSVEEIGVSLNEAGYIKPWNSGSHIHFSGDGYQNCSL